MESRHVSCPSRPTIVIYFHDIYFQLTLVDFSIMYCLFAGSIPFFQFLTSTPFVKASNDLGVETSRIFAQVIIGFKDMNAGTKCWAQRVDNNSNNTHTKINLGKTINQTKTKPQLTSITNNEHQKTNNNKQQPITTHKDFYVENPFSVKDKNHGTSQGSPPKSLLL